METVDFKFMTEDVSYDDEVLLQKYKKILSEKEKRKAFFEESLQISPEDDYIRVAVSRLAYVFAKEEHDALLEEMKRRGLAQ